MRKVLPSQGINDSIARIVVFVNRKVLVAVVVFLVMILMPAGIASAQGAEDFVTIYDSGEQTRVKTDAATVGEALERLGMVLIEGDVVEPGLETRVDADLQVKIYRARPVMVVDGSLQIRAMTTATEAREIVTQAGVKLGEGDVVELTTFDGFLEAGMMVAYRVRRVVPEVADEQETVAILEEAELKLKEATKLTPTLNVRPLTRSMGRNRYVTKDGKMRQETYYDLNMRLVMRNCGQGGYYTVRADGVKVDKDGFVIVAAHLGRYPRCTLVETSVGWGKVYDTGGFARVNPEQLDIATDWSRRNGI